MQQSQAGREDFPYVLTAHAAHVLVERQIQLAWVARTLAGPEKVEVDPTDAGLRHALSRIPENEGRVLRVIYVEADTPWRIVTAFFDRRQRGKL